METDPNETVWNHPDDKPIHDNQSVLLPFEPLILNEGDEMPDSCTHVDCATANEIRAQSLQDFTIHGRAHQSVMAALEGDHKFFGSLLMAQSIDNHREVGAIESRATDKVMGP